MKRLSALALLISVFAFSAVEPKEPAQQKAPRSANDYGKAPTKTGEDAIKRTLIELETQSWKAWKRRDGKFFQEFLSDDHVEVGSGGVIGKAAVVAGVASPSCAVKSYSLAKFELTAFDADRAVLTYYAEQDTACNGNAVPSPVWASSLYVKRGGRWLNALYQQTPASQDGDAAQLKALTREFAEGFNSGDVDRVMRLYAETYVDVNLRHPVQTKAERREYYRKIMERRDTKVEVIPEEIIVNGEFGFVRGTLLLSRAPAGDAPARRLELRYIEVWRKFPDGWKSIWGMDADLYPDSEK